MKELAPLERVIHQSLLAITQNGANDNEVQVHLRSLLVRISRFFRTTADVLFHSVIEPNASTIAIDGHAVQCPRLLVQCQPRDVVPARCLTFIYTPVSATRVTLRIAYDNVVHLASDVIQWTSLHNDWCISGHGIEMDADTHASFVRTALSGAKLFSLCPMTLEPKRCQ